MTPRTQAQHAPGQIVQGAAIGGGFREYAVRCSRCPATHTFQAQRRGKALRARGWAFWRQGGWVCPACERAFLQCQAAQTIPQRDKDGDQDGRSG